MPQTALRVVGGIGLVASVILGASVAVAGVTVPLALIALPGLAWLALHVSREPRLGLVLALISGFVGVGLRRYVPAPTGLLVDGLLVLTLAGLVYRTRRYNDVDWSRARTGLVAAALVWGGYVVFQAVNPEARSLTAWFYAGRGVALYFVLTVVAGLVVFTRRSDLRRFLQAWMALSLIGTLWGAKQLFIGLDPFEQAWLSVPGNLSTHVLFGKLRVFSFYSDAGQFGAAQGHVLVVAGVIALGSRGRRRVLFGLVALASLYGLLISGTRGAMAVPFVGFLAYFVLSKNWRILLLGLLAVTAVYGVLRYTHIAHNVYEVRRMRTAIVQGADNPSLQVRIENQRRLAEYLETRPFGGGVGSAGYWGTRFTPGTFLAELPLDSWYVKIWAEGGIAGLTLYLVLMALVALGALRHVMRETDAERRLIVLALYAGFLGILAASYGNQVLGQMPTGLAVYLSLAFIWQRSPTKTPRSPKVERVEPSMPVRFGCSSHPREEASNRSDRRASARFDHHREPQRPRRHRGAVAFAPRRDVSQRGGAGR